MRTPIARTLAALALVAALVGATLFVVHLTKGSMATTVTSECMVPLTATPATETATATSTTTSTATPVPVYLAAVQLQHASTINAVGMSRGLPARARVIAIATAFQESGLRNLPSGDLDSVGLFQQRPSQGWGTKSQILDPVYAAGKFYDALVRVPGWQLKTVTKAAQAVQYSAFPDAYAKWEGQATTLAVALGGAQPLQLSCIAGAQPPTADPPHRAAMAGTAGAPAALVTVLSAAQAELGGLRVAALAGSTATLQVTVPGMGVDAAGRALAAWAVAHSTGFPVTTVSVDDQSWSAHAWTRASTRLPVGRVLLTTG